MKKRRRRPVPKPPNLAARALGSKIFGLKVVTPKKGYSRKAKHKKAPDEQLPPFLLRRDSEES